MSTWRRKAIESFPTLRREFEQPQTTIYQVFFELLPRLRDSHARKDVQEVQRIYDFGRWCLHQNADGISNAAAVAFYEHLVDDPITRSQIPRWLQPDDFEICKGLFEARLEPDQFQELCDKYANRHKRSSAGG